MKKLIVTIQEKPRSYPIVIGENLIETIDSLIEFGRYSKIAIITSKNVPKVFLKKLKEAISFETTEIIVESGEKAKNIDTVIEIWNRLQKMGADRKSLVVNLGGGTICDMGGFAAATYMRGINFLQIPTTVIAQVEASSGGKTGINFNNNKNYIGVFQDAVGVIIDVATLSSLPKRIFDHGFAEIIKHGLIADSEYFDFVTSKKPGEFNTSELVQMLSKSNEIKSRIVEEDQRDSGLRKIINFGHTIANAIESISLETGSSLLHGEALNVGMMIETKISELTGLLDKKDAEYIYDRLGRIGLPVRISNINKDNIMRRIRLDKKNVGGKINWTLLDAIGHAVFDKRVEDKTVGHAIELFLD